MAGRGKAGLGWARCGNVWFPGETPGFFIGKMIKKIAIIGTHSTGKTTLSYILASEQKKLGKSVKIIQEVARSCPYPLNEGMTRECCLWIYHEHVKKELEAIQKFDTVICDRSAIDSFMYAKVKKCFEFTDLYMHHCYQGAITWMNTYDEIIWVRPNSKNPTPDGIRSTDKEFQMDVDHEFKKNQLIFDHMKIKILNIDDVFSMFPCKSQA